MVTKPFPILFITATDIPGAIASSGLIKRLIDEVPGARFTIVAGPATAPLFEEVPELEEIIVVGDHESRVRRFALWRWLRRRRWGLIVDTRGGGLSGMLKRQKRAVHQPRPGEVVHKVVEAGRLLGIEDDPPAPSLFTSAETEAEAQALVPVKGGPILAIGPGAQWIGRAWPVERFAQVAARLLGPGGRMAGGRLVVVGPSGGGDPLEATRFSITRPYLASRPGALGLLGDVALLKRARLFIGNDGPWMHLAAVAGAPTLGLFGPSDERVSRPWGPKARVVRGHRSFEDFQAIDPNLNQAIGHMMDLSIEKVLAAAVELLDSTEPRNG
jgi:ADP-heptose:LPS heptosyltransferase